MVLKEPGYKGTWSYNDRAESPEGISGGVTMFKILIGVHFTVGGKLELDWVGDLRQFSYGHYVADVLLQTHEPWAMNQAVTITPELSINRLDLAVPRFLGLN